MSILTGLLCPAVLEQNSSCEVRRGIPEAGNPLRTVSWPENSEERVWKWRKQRLYCSTRSNSGPPARTTATSRASQTGWWWKLCANFQRYKLWLGEESKQKEQKTAPWGPVQASCGRSYLTSHRGRKCLLHPSLLHVSALWIPSCLHTRSTSRDVQMPPFYLQVFCQQLCGDLGQVIYLMIFLILPSQFSTIFKD